MAKEAVDKATKILRGAMQEFLEHGYAGTSMDRVAAAAGVSKATVYSYFADKEGLFTALVKQMAALKLSAIAAAKLPDTEPIQALRTLAGVCLDQCSNDAEYVTFTRLIIGESGRFPELAKIFVQDLIKPTVDGITCFLSSHSVFARLDAYATARIVSGSLMHYMFVEKILEGSEILPIEKEKLLDALIFLIVP